MIMWGVLVGILTIGAIIWLWIGDVEAFGEILVSWFLCCWGLRILLVKTGVMAVGDGDKLLVRAATRLGWILGGGPFYEFLEYIGREKWSLLPGCVIGFCLCCLLIAVVVIYALRCWGQ